uniref:Gypsy retrotransposon integrase-like protein 1 n=1 Tax=Phallusia mammillata TaxID=59560 RepID=A0A6F9DCY9_9ASCI|nr:uncharacterized protein zf(cchc)-26 [Phallusia mammillata]
MFEQPEQPRSVPVAPVLRDSTTGDSNWLDEWTIADIRKWQNEDPELSAILRLKAISQHRPSREEFVDRTGNLAYFAQWDWLLVRNGVLYREWLPDEDGGEVIRLLVAPRSLQKMIFDHLHVSRTAGHLGTTRTIEQIRRRFYWPGFRNDIRLWCRWCQNCTKRKPTHGRHRGKLQQQPAHFPLERIGIDFLGPLPCTERGNMYILVVSDYFTRWTESFALPDQQATTTANTLVTEFFCRFGTSKYIHSNQGRDFESRLFHEMCSLLEIKKTRNTPYHPQSSGLVERFNRTLLQMLSTFVNDHHNDWDIHAPYLMMAYQSSQHESTKFTPNHLMLGRNVHVPPDIMSNFDSHVSQSACYTHYVQHINNCMRNSVKMARLHFEQSAQSEITTELCCPLTFGIGCGITTHQSVKKARPRLGGPIFDC